MVLGSAIQVTMSSAPATRNMGRQRARTVHASHRNSPGRAMRVTLRALYRSTGRTDCFHATSFRRCDRILITASIPLEGQRRLSLCVHLIVRFRGGEPLARTGHRPEPGRTVQTRCGRLAFQ
jgi:hypothetical protein